MKWIFFDCMETLVDFDPIPRQLDYAAWAFYESGVEEYWENFEQFYDLFTKAGSFLSSIRPPYKEWLTKDRFLHICSHTPGISPDKVKFIASKIEESFFTTYCSKSFVQPDVQEMLPLLSRKALLGVVSNFKVNQGILTILKQHHLLQYFKFVLTSAETGWRKPHFLIYREAIELTDGAADQILFIGDDVENDVIGPKNHGMKALLLDRYHVHADQNKYHRINNFKSLRDIIS